MFEWGSTCGPEEGIPVTYLGAAFSLSVGFGVVDFLVGLLKIWTWAKGLTGGFGDKGLGIGNIKLPPLHVFAGFFAGDYDDEFRDFTTDHPFVELGHDFLDVGFNLIV